MDDRRRPPDRLEALAADLAALERLLQREDGQSHLPGVRALRRIVASVGPGDPDASAALAQARALLAGMLSHKEGLADFHVWRDEFEARSRENAALEVLMSRIRQALDEPPPARLPAVLDGLRGIENVSGRDAGSAWQWSFALVPGAEPETLGALLDRAGPHDEIALADPAAGERWRELRRAGGAWQRKHGGHGRHGDWRDCDEAEALAWLLEVAADNRAGAPGQAPAGWVRRKPRGTGA